MTLDLLFERRKALLTELDEVGNQIKQLITLLIQEIEPSWYADMELAYIPALSKTWPNFPKNTRLFLKEMGTDQCVIGSGTGLRWTVDRNTVREMREVWLSQHD